MSRNKDRFGGHKPEHSEAPVTQFNPLNFVAPTEFVELPSKGLEYPETHPLFEKETVEIKFMTAKDEDILTSQALLKNGLAIDRFLQNVILDKTINIDTLLVGDKNAILVSARGSGYGYDYDARVTCGECGTKNRVEFDLKNPIIVNNLEVDETITKRISPGVYETEMPFSKFKVNYRLMNSSDENAMAKGISNAPENREHDLLTSQFKRLIVSIEGHEDQTIIDQYVDNMPTVDSRHFKICIKATTPNIQIKETMTCKNCSAQKEVDVPYGTDFFWPDL